MSQNPCMGQCTCMSRESAQNLAVVAQKLTERGVKYAKCRTRMQFAHSGHKIVRIICTVLTIFMTVITIFILDIMNAEVQEVMNRVPRGDRIIVMDDFNARVGKNVKGSEGSDQ